VSATSAHAVDGCKVKIDSKTGTILVSAKNITGTPLWGPAPGEETNAFDDAGTCVAASSASKCHLGPAGSALAITPPPLCRIYLADDGATDCSAYIKDCTPGLRDDAALDADIAALQADNADQEATIDALQAENASQQTTIDAEQADVDALLIDVLSLQADVAALQTLLASVSLADSGMTVRFTGVS
jgi:uncharacterized coiled-coil protein SlyX